jgi:hypothetical protein
MYPIEINPSTKKKKKSPLLNRQVRETPQPISWAWQLIPVISAIMITD